jgi:hypothetical protein
MRTLIMVTLIYTHGATDEFSPFFVSPRYFVLSKFGSFAMNDKYACFNMNADDLCVTLLRLLNHTHP